MGCFDITAFNLIGEVDIGDGFIDFDDLLEFVELNGLTVATFMPFLTEDSELDFFMGDL